MKREKNSNFYNFRLKLGVDELEELLNEEE